MERPSSNPRGEQKIQFCTARDGAKIAYATTGEGPPLVRAAHYLSHLEFDFESPVWRHWIRELSKYNNYIRYDERGCGLSDQNPPQFSFDAWVSDLETVVDSLGLEKFDLLGISQGGAVAIAYAARHPERVKHLVLYGAYSRGWGRRPSAADSGRALETRNTMNKLIELGWGQDNPAFRQLFTSLFVPEGGPEEQGWFNELQRVSCSPQNAMRFDKVFGGIDVTPVLSKVSVPTLILHARGDSVAPLEEGRLLASRIPEARFISFEGRNHILRESEAGWDIFLREIRRFIGPPIEETWVSVPQHEVLKLPLLEEILPGGLRFGANYLVEFEPQSIWYEASLTLCAQALRLGTKTDYHTFTHPPEDVRRQLVQMGVDLGKLEANDTFRIWDSYAVQTGLVKSGSRGGGLSRTDSSLKMEDWDKGSMSAIRGEVPEADMRRLHIDDNTSVLLHFNDEKRVSEHFRTLTIPFARRLELAAVHSVAAGMFSDNFYREFESFCDGVMDFRAKEEGDRIGHYMRLRFMRGASHDSSWRRLEVTGGGEVTVTHSSGLEEIERRLAAIMFTDTVGSTALAQRNEALALELMEDQKRIVRPLFSQHRGREVKSTGDGFLVEFASALDAVRCATAIQSALGESNRKSPEERRLLVRIGIHLGDVIHTGKDLAGDAVNVASRIEPLAPAGGICLTAQVYASVLNKVNLSFESIGTPQLKGVSTPIEVFRVAGYGEAQERPLTVSSVSTARRIAVLPFRNISPDPNDEYFADGMTEELISAISKIGGLRVIARTSVMKYKGKDKAAGDIARELGVNSLLEGSVRKQGGRARISVHLVDPANEEERWTEEYDRELQDIFAVQGDISRKVAEALKVQVFRRELIAAGREGTQKPEAYVQYLLGRQHWNRRTKADLEEAVTRFEEALEVDPTYAKAYSGIADSYAMLASYATEYLPPLVAYPKAQAAVKKALELDPDLVEAHVSLGVVKFHYDWDWDGAEAEFKRAIDLGPSYAPAHQFYSDHLKALGRLDEALREVRKAQELDPLSLPINSAVGHVLYLSRQYDAAIEQYRRVVELDPTFMTTHIWFGRPLLEKRKFDEALEELRTGVRLSGESSVALGMLGHGLASAGKYEEALEIVQRLKERSRTQYVSSYWIAAVYNGMKDREETMAWLRKAYEERSSWLVWCNVEPRFDWIRDDLGFVSLMKAMRFP